MYLDTHTIQRVTSENRYRQTQTADRHTRTKHPAKHTYSTALAFQESLAHTYTDRYRADAHTYTHTHTHTHIHRETYFSPQSLVSFPISVKIGRSIKATFAFVSHEENLTSAHTQKHAHACTTLLGVSCACSDLFTIHCRLTAVTLRAQHLSANQTHCGRTTVISVRIWTPAKKKLKGYVELLLDSQLLVRRGSFPIR